MDFPLHGAFVSPVSFACYLSSASTSSTFSSSFCPRQRLSRQQPPHAQKESVIYKVLSESGSHQEQDSVTFSSQFESKSRKSELPDIAAANALLSVADHLSHAVRDLVRTREGFRAFNPESVDFELPVPEEIVQVVDDSAAELERTRNALHRLKRTPTQRPWCDSGLFKADESEAHEAVADVDAVRDWSKIRVRRDEDETHESVLLFDAECAWASVRLARRAGDDDDEVHWADSPEEAGRMWAAVHPAGRQHWVLGDAASVFRGTAAGAVASNRLAARLRLENPELHESEPYVTAMRDWARVPRGLRNWVEESELHEAVSEIEAALEWSAVVMPRGRWIEEESELHEAILDDEVMREWTAVRPIQRCLVDEESELHEAVSEDEAVREWSAVTPLLSRWVDDETELHETVGEDEALRVWGAIDPHVDESGDPIASFKVRLAPSQADEADLYGMLRKSTQS